MHKIKVDNMLPSVPQYIITYEVVAEGRRKARMCMLIKSASSSERLDEVGRVTDTRHLANCLLGSNPNYFTKGKNVPVSQVKLLQKSFRVAEVVSNGKILSDIAI